MKDAVSNPVRCFLYVALFLAIAFPRLSYLHEDFFIVDDQELVLAPPLTGGAVAAQVASIFTPGNSVDFYPVRDITHLIENAVIGSQANSYVGLVYRVTNLVLFFLIAAAMVELLRGWGIPRQYALLAVIPWALNPFHNELVSWISSRKDLLALFFGVLSLHFFSRWYCSDRLRSYLACCLFFLMSVFSKAAICVLPIAALPFVLWERRKLSTRKSFLTVVLIVIGVLSAVFHSYFYSRYNDMRFFYSLDHRVFASVSALGRQALGWFFYPVNTIDLVNWGEWDTMNGRYFPFGVALHCLTAGLTGYAWKKRRPVLFTFMISYFLLFIPISALLFPHRNFYSVRYFEAPALALYLASVYGAYTWLRSSSRRFSVIWSWVVVSTSLFFGLAGYLDTPNWESNLAILNKSLGLTPTNEALLFLKSQEMDNLKMWGRLDEKELMTLGSLKTELANRCLHRLESAVTAKGDLCFPYLSNVVRLSRGPRTNTFAESATLEKFENWVLRHVEATSPQRILLYHTINNLEAALNGDVGRKPEFLTQLRPIMETRADLRNKIWAYLCLFESYKAAVEYYGQMRRRVLIEEVGAWAQVSSATRKLAKQQDWHACAPSGVGRTY